MAATELEFPKAVITLLRADATLMATVKKISDRRHPTGDGGATAPFPYVTVNPTFREWDTDTTKGFEVMTRIHTWSRSGSYAETRTIQGRIYALLHKASLTVTGCNHVTTMREDTEVFDDPDGETIHGVCEYRTLLVKTS